MHQQKVLRRHGAFLDDMLDLGHCSLRDQQNGDGNQDMYCPRADKRLFCLVTNSLKTPFR